MPLLPKKIDIRIKIGLVILTVFFLVFVAKAFGIFIGPDTQCSYIHRTISQLPSSLQTAQDFFAAGNYYYDIGKCEAAVNDYTKAIQLDNSVPEFYNNRGYTYMRLRNYAPALSDMNKAIAIRPDYIQALLNRADLYNFYGPVIDRQKAITEYEHLISLGAVHDTSVCGHLAMAQTNNMVPLAILKFIFNRGYCN
ncbi:MAG: tetratricopeptide repeat protein [Candidatus Levyibacteriota bacterium]